MNNLKTELRIGNIVFYQGTTFGNVEISDKDLSDFITGKFDEIGVEIKPIKLTEEIYKKLGGNFRIDEGWIISDDDGGIYCCDDNDQMIFCPPCEFVHQLQNLYYALTGQELQCACLV
jgi:hypothetical protein